MGGEADAGSSPATCNVDEGQTWGDVIIDAPATDEFGTYCHTTIDPESDAFVYDTAHVNVPSLTKYGFTEDHAHEAQKVVVTWLAEQVLDSTRLDNYAQPAAEWFAANRGPLPGTWAAGVETDGLRDNGTLVTDVLPSPLRRTGEPRAKSTDITIDQIGGGAGADGVPTLVVNTSAVVVWDATDKAIVAAVIKYDPAQSEDTLKASIPELFDDKDTTEIVLKGTFSYGFVGGPDGLVMNGQQASYTLETGSGALLIE